MKKLFLSFALVAAYAATMTGSVVLDSTNFPDENFRAYVSQRTGVAEGATITDAVIAAQDSWSDYNSSIPATELNITSMKGIEHFTSLRYLNCSSNRLTALDLSTLTNLEQLDCSNNMIESLNLSKNARLQVVDCGNNRLNALDVTGDRELTTLCCHYNNIGELNLTDCSKLTRLKCDNNRLSSLDLSHCTGLTQLDVQANRFIDFDASALTALTYFEGRSQQTAIHATAVTRNGKNMYRVAMPATFVNNPAKDTYMEKILWGASESEVVGGITYVYLDSLQDFYYQYRVGNGNNIILVTVSPITDDQVTEVQLNETNFPDPEFRAYVSQVTKVAEGGYLTYNTLARFYSFSDDKFRNRAIKSLKGIEYFYNMGVLNCSNCQITSVDFSKNKHLIDINLNGNPLTTLILGEQQELHNIFCAYCKLTTLDITRCPELVFLNLNTNNITTLDITRNAKLHIVDLGNNHITSLDVTHNTELLTLYIDNNHLTSIDVSKNTALQSLGVNCSMLSNIDVSHNINLKRLYCYNNQLTSVDVTSNPDLVELSCTNNRLTSLDVSHNNLLTFLACDGNEISSIDLSKNVDLQKLYVDYNSLETLDLKANTKLVYLKADHNQLSSLDLSNNVALEEVDLNYNHLMQFDATMLNNLKTFNGENQTISMPFRAMVNDNGYTVTMPADFVNGDTAPRVLNSAIDYSTAAQGGATTFYPPFKQPFSYTYLVRPADGQVQMHLNVQVSPGPDAIFGDVTGDGIIDIVDVNAILSVLLGEVSPETFEGRADVNGDGIVDVLDLNIVVDIVLGL